MYTLTSNIKKGRREQLMVQMKVMNEKSQSVAAVCSLVMFYITLTHQLLNLELLFHLTIFTIPYPASYLNHYISYPTHLWQCFEIPFCVVRWFTCRMDGWLQNNETNMFEDLFEGRTYI